MDHHSWHETISILQLQIKKCKCLATVNCKMTITEVMETNTLVHELQWFRPQFEPLYIALPSSFTVICCILALPEPDKYRRNALKRLVDWPAYDSHFCLLHDLQPLQLSLWPRSRLAKTGAYQATKSMHHWVGVNIQANSSTHLEKVVTWTYSATYALVKPQGQKIIASCHWTSTYPLTKRTRNPPTNKYINYCNPFSWQCNQHSQDLQVKFTQNNLSVADKN